MTGVIVAAVVGLLSFADLYLTITSYEKGEFEKLNPFWEPMLGGGAYGLLLVMKTLITCFFCIVIAVAWPHVMAVFAVAVAVLGYAVVLYRHWQWREIMDRVRFSSDAELIALDMMNLPRDKRLRALEKLRVHDPALYGEVRQIIEDIKEERAEMEDGQ